MGIFVIIASCVYCSVGGSVMAAIVCTRGILVVVSGSFRSASAGLCGLATVLLTCFLRSEFTFVSFGSSPALSVAVVKSSFELDGLLGLIMSLVMGCSPSSIRTVCSLGTSGTPVVLSSGSLILTPFQSVFIGTMTHAPDF